ncbi:MAG TPA: VOC family protein [Caulobacteraceae bacterium]|nr:VOC family protein [Caulobacteraceae bacterium]
MIDHFGFHCRDASVSLPFYRACLEPLGIRAVQEQPEYKAAIFKKEGSPVFWWFGEGDEASRGRAGAMRVHLGFAATSAAEVDAFHAAALAHGGRDNGPPGFRRPTCYSAFVFDPDGNNIEAIWQTERA